jgi:hypothetical protein
VTQFDMKVIAGLALFDVALAGTALGAGISATHKEHAPARVVVIGIVTLVALLVAGGYWRLNAPKRIPVNTATAQPARRPSRLSFVFMAAATTPFLVRGQGVVAAVALSILAGALGGLSGALLINICSPMRRQAVICRYRVRASGQR